MIESNDAMLSEVPPAVEMPPSPVLTDVTAFVPPGHPYANPMPPADPAVAADPVPVAAADPAVVAPLPEDSPVVPEVMPLAEWIEAQGAILAPVELIDCGVDPEVELSILWRQLRNLLNRLPDELQGEAHGIVSKIQKIF